MTAKELFNLRAREQAQRREAQMRAELAKARRQARAARVAEKPADVVKSRPASKPAAVIEPRPARKQKIVNERRPVGRPRKPRPEKQQPPAGWRTVGEYAASGDASRGTILNGIKDGIIHSVKIGRERWFDPATLAEYRRRGKEQRQHNMRVALAAWADKHGAHRAPPGTMRVRDLARKYGKSEAGIYKAIRLGQLPSVKAGALRCVRPSDFEDYMARAKEVLAASAVRAYTAKMRKCAERKKETRNDQQD